MFVENSQQPAVQWKHTVLLTWPSATEGCPPFIQLVTSVPHLLVGWHEGVILMPAEPSNRSRSDSTVTITVVRSILFHNTQLLALIVIKIWENWSSALEEVETVIDSRSKHEFSAKKGLGRVGRSTFLLGADQRLSGEGVFNGIYYCPLGFRAPCTRIPLLL